MENWGLVTYRETALLIDPENSSSHAKQWVALVVGHELAHQWFGNLVTMVRIISETITDPFIIKQQLHWFKHKYKCIYPNFA